MKFRFVAIFATLLLSVPFAVLAACSSDRYTVIYVNGIHTTKDQADGQLALLKKQFTDLTHRTDVNFITGYNPTHLAGIDDDVQSTLQMNGLNQDDYDFKVILQQLHTDLQTRRVLLLGHSQGTFYTNLLYDYLTMHGVSRDSIAVYNLATPANYVAGGGTYLTSSNDKLIQAVRKGAAILSVPPPLSPNITIPYAIAGDISDPGGGHDFTIEYLNGAPDRIILDTQTALTRLAASDSTIGDCFTPQPLTLSDQIVGASYAVLDPVASTTRAMNPILFDYGIAPTSFVATAMIVGTGKALAIDLNNATQLATAASSLATNLLANIFGALASVGTNQGAAVATAVTPTNSTTAVQPSTPKAAVTVVKLSVAPTLPQPIQPPPALAKVPQSPPSAPPSSPVTPGFGGGGMLPPDPDDPPAQDQDADAATPLSILSPADDSLFATTTVTFTGTTTPNEIVSAAFGSANASTTADTDGDWSLMLTLPEGSTSVAFSVDGATSTRAVIVDTTPPATPALSIAECAYSLSTSSCLIATTTATLSWPEIADATKYAIAANGAWVATTTGTSATLALPDEATSVLQIVATDAAGNAATSSAQAVNVFLQPIAFNEIDWSGTVADSSAQWIGLKNRTVYDIDLSRVIIASASGSINIPLSGTMQSSSAYPIDIYRDAYATPATGMSTDGEQLALVEDMGVLGFATLDATPSAAACSGWCAGSSGGLPMERIDASSDGTLAASWRTYVPPPAPPPPSI